MKKMMEIRFEKEIKNLQNAKSSVDEAFLAGVLSGMATALFYETDMSVKEYVELNDFANTGMIRRPCELCYDKTFENSEGQRVSCSHTGYEVHFAGDFIDDRRNWCNEYTDANGEIYYGR